MSSELYSDPGSLVSAAGVSSPTGPSGMRSPSSQRVEARSHRRCHNPSHLHCCRPISPSSAATAVVPAVAAVLPRAPASPCTERSRHYRSSAGARRPPRPGDCAAIWRTYARHDAVRAHGLRGGDPEVLEQQRIERPRGSDCADRRPPTAAPAAASACAGSPLAAAPLPASAQHSADTRRLRPALRAAILGGGLLFRTGGSARRRKLPRRRIRR
jgi:hypothetical protein